MSLVKLLTALAQLAPLAVKAYKYWAVRRRRAKRKQQQDAIRHDPTVTFSDEFGEPAGRVRLTASDPLPSDPATPDVVSRGE
ncbi:hypothetical protein HC752_21820 [Vibrio sp. S9_S30]|uniref:hypothetical protein n=1 Tax=Vibrio sp. S9_S30 TaxID=2720226 RepID=UPI001681839C|nr:hypothetical protein [Vibrio sp. S9_S30]MBD1559585.1 hypothetical protein [Vibrio sp. S9_S30]